MLAFPSTYSVGITSLGYQVVWPNGRPHRSRCARLFTDQGPTPSPLRSVWSLAELELDGPVPLDLLEQQRIPLWSSER